MAHVCPTETTQVPYGHATVRRDRRFWTVMDPIDALRTDPNEADARLLAGLARDLDAVFPTLVTEHQDRLYSIALRMLGDPNDAEEAAQDALVRAYRALATYDTARIAELRLRGWLATIVLNLCRSRVGRRAARGPAPTSLDDDARGPVDPRTSERSSPEAVVSRRAERDAWAERLLRLPPSYRSAVVLRHVDGLSYPETAAALGRPEGTVKAQVHRGIAMLRTMLEAEGRPEPQEMTA
jgi:RNA polymerase sigma-70 factor (ECF subfamily)